MSKKTIILCVALILALTLGLGGTLAYLTDTDADKNVMTVGRVQVVQNEQQRVEDGNGIFTSILEQFEDDKMLLPVTSRDNTPDTVTVGEWEVTMDDDLNNYIDKIISATNTGNTDAWVRTLVAVPTGAATEDPKEYWNDIDSASDNWLHWNAMPDPVIDGESVEQWSWPAKELGFITVDDVVYAVFAFTHHEKVAPGETTYPVVRGLYMDERVDMDVVKDEEGKLVDQYYMMVNGEKQVIYDVPDKNGKVNMLVLTQAVQADGFATAEEAFDKAFALGDNEAATLFNWFGGEDGWSDEEIGSPGDKNDTNNPPDMIYNNADMYDASIAGGEYKLGADYTISEFVEGESYSSNRSYAVKSGAQLTVDLNGHNIVLNAGTNAWSYLYTMAYNGGLTFKGSGKVSVVNPEKKETSIFYAQSTGSITIDDGTYEVTDGIAVWAGNGAHAVINGGEFIANKNGTNHEMIYASNGGVIDIYGGFFHYVGGGDILNIENRGNGGIINLYGGTFVNYDPENDIASNDKANIIVADGYKVVSEPQDNGDVWYKVVKE